MRTDWGKVPDTLSGFSWAGFLWGGIWALAHRVWIGAFSFVPGLGLIMNVMLGLRGVEWAWRAGAIPDVERFKKAQRAWVVVWLVVAAASVPVMGLGSAVAIYGVRKYIVNAKRAEAASLLGSMTSGMAACGARGDLPETSNWVPDNPGMIRGMKYQSVASDWAREAAFACSGFSTSSPQYFRYRWRQVTTASGQFEAEADLNGDGLVDETLQQGVHCVAGSCIVEPAIGNLPGTN